MNRRVLVGAALAATLVGSLSGCGSNDDGSASPASSGPTVIATVSGEGLAGGEPPTITMMTEDPKLAAVVEGRVVKVEYRLMESLTPVTLMTIEVARTTKDVSDTLTVLEFGGLIPLTDHPESDQKRYAKAAAGEDPDNAVIDYPGAGNGTHPEVGDQVVLFLKSNKGQPGGDDAYYVTRSALGRFTREPNGDFMRAGKPDTSRNPDVESKITREQVTQLFG